MTRLPYRTLGFCLLFFAFQTFVAHAQNRGADPVFTVVDSLPSFPGGAEKLTEFVRKSVSPNIREEIAKEAKLRQYFKPRLVTFIVEKDGTLSNITGREDTIEAFKNEAMRIVSIMPKWLPGKKDGQVVRTQLTLPISFNLDTIQQGATSSGLQTIKSKDGFEYLGYDFGGTLSITYEYALLMGAIGEKLDYTFGYSLDCHFLDNTDDDDHIGLGVYYTWIRTSVKEEFERRDYTWQIGRESSINELGAKLSYRLESMEDNQLEIFPTLQAGGVWHRRAQKRAEDSGLGIGTTGFSLGLGCRVNWYFAETENDNYHVLHLNVCQRQLFMKSPLKGGMLTLGIGYTWLFGE